MYSFFPRLIAALLQLMLALFFYLIRKKYHSLKALCWTYRVSDIQILKTILHPIFVSIAKKCYQCDENPILAAFLKTSFAKKIPQKYSIHDLTNSINIFRDALLLSPNDGDKKGVIIIEYAESFDAVGTLFQLKELMQRYILVLETSWSGACDPTFFMFIHKNSPVIVEFPEIADCQFIASLDTNLIPWQNGAGDWLETKLTTETIASAKLFDIVMVANWAKHKNHKILFNALGKLKNKKLKVLLIGFSFQGRTKDDILNEFNTEVGNNHDIELTIKESISSKEVMYYLSVSKMFVLLTRKEGANRALSESFAAGTPAIVYKYIKGGAAERINDATGVLSDYHELDKNIEYMLENHSRFTPKEYITCRSNCHNSTVQLKKLLEKTCLQNNIQCNLDIVEKTNNPNFKYVDLSDKDVFKPEYDKLLQHCLRK